jgi:hypothetical protein
MMATAVAGLVGSAVIAMVVAAIAHEVTATIDHGLNAQRAAIDQDEMTRDLANQDLSVHQTSHRSVNPGSAQNDLGRIRFAFA